MLCLVFSTKFFRRSNLQHDSQTVHMAVDPLMLLACYKERDAPVVENIWFVAKQLQIKLLSSIVFHFLLIYKIPVKLLHNSYFCFLGHV